MNRTIEFKKDLEDKIKTLEDDLNFLDMFSSRIMNKMKKTWDRPQQAGGSGHQRPTSSSSVSPQAAGHRLRSESGSSKSDSSGARETKCNAASHSSDESGQHPLHAATSEQHQVSLLS